MVAFSIRVEIALDGVMRHLPGAATMIARKLRDGICVRLNEEFARRNLQIGGALRIDDARIEDRLLRVQYFLKLDPDHFHVAYETARGWMKLGVIVAQRVIDPYYFQKIVATALGEQVKDELCSRLAEDIRTGMQTLWLRADHVLVTVENQA